MYYQLTQLVQKVDNTLLIERIYFDQMVQIVLTQLHH